MRLSAETDHVVYMDHALVLAKQAGKAGEVPVGAVVVRNNEIIGEGFNQPISNHDPSAHAEIVAIRDAASRVGNYRLTGAMLYVTLEPCIMCAGAILQARIDRLIFGARDHQYGAAGSALNLLESEFLNHQAIVVAGVREIEAGTLLSNFFESRRS